MPEPFGSIVGLLFIVLIIVFLLGMINPQIAMPWGKKVTRADILIFLLLIPTVLTIATALIVVMVQSDTLDKADRIVGGASLAVLLPASLVVIGLIKPNYVIRWGNLRNRTRVLLYYGTPILLIVGVILLLRPTLIAIDKREAQKQFHKVSSTPNPLEMKDNSVVGIKGIIINKTTLDEAIKSFGKNPHTVKNFYFVWQDRGIRSYKSLQQINEISSETIISVKNDIINKIGVITTIKNENALKKTYEEVLQERKTSLGLPSRKLNEEFAFVWDYPKTGYVLRLVPHNIYRVEIIEMVANN